MALPDHECWDFDPSTVLTALHTEVEVDRPFKLVIVPFLAHEVVRTCLDKLRSADAFLSSGDISEQLK